MVREILSQGLTLRAAAAARRVSEKTVRRWLSRAREEGLQARFEDRSSVPKHQPRKTSSPLASKRGGCDARNLEH